MSVRVRFAPSPTGALHIGGVRTALYNYLFAKKNGGTFILRIEDTDQTRYVEGAEAYIQEALDWLGFPLDEGPKQGGDYGPYRQSERKALYGQYAQQLIDGGNAYYAFDTPEELTAIRSEYESRKETFKYGLENRHELINSLTLSKEEVQNRIANGDPYTVRLRMPADEEVVIQDIIRGTVRINTTQLDDKVILKADGLPTYHLANIVDDHLMKISHVIRGEEWLPSTAHHVLMYRFLNWETTMPQFAHLPLIMKPTGKGKLSKRDGKKLGIPVFPLSWKGATEEDSFDGFREVGFDPKAVLNFLAMLGWNPGDDREMFSLKELTEVFSLERVNKSGAKFDYDKAKWYNEQYIMTTPDAELAAAVAPHFKAKGFEADATLLAKICELYKERITFLNEMPEKAYYFFTDITEYQQKPTKKKWKLERRPVLNKLIEKLDALTDFTEANIEANTKAFIEDEGLGFGDVLPFLRVATSGTMKGPSVFAIIEVLGKDRFKARMQKGMDIFDSWKTA